MAQSLLQNAFGYRRVNEPGSSLTAPVLPQHVLHTDFVALRKRRGPALPAHLSERSSPLALLKTAQAGSTSSYQMPTRNKRESHPKVADCPQSADGARRGVEHQQPEERPVSAEHPSAQFTVLRLVFQSGNDFAEDARCGKYRAPFVVGFRPSPPRPPWRGDAPLDGSFPVRVNARGDRVRFSLVASPGAHTFFPTTQGE